MVAFKSGAEIPNMGTTRDGVLAFSKSAMMRPANIIHVIPTRGTFPALVVEKLLDMQFPPNQGRARFMPKGMEVGAAYDETIAFILKSDTFKKFNFILTTEEDNLVPADAVIKLVAAIYTCPDCDGPIVNEDTWTCAEGHHGYDGVGGLYFMKTTPPIPMAFGDPKSPEIEFVPRDVLAAFDGHSVMEVSGIANGCSLFRKQLFADMSTPRFLTVAGDEDGGITTQDLYMCRKAKEELGARFGVHCGVRVGHMDVKTGELF